MPWNALAALAVLLAAGLAELQPARAQGGALPPDVSAAIESAIQAGEAAAANAAVSAGFANDAARTEIVNRARSQVEETALAEAVVDGIAQHPDAVSAIVRAAVQRAPAYRDAIMHRAAISFPAYAAEIAAAAGVPRAPRAPAIAPAILPQAAPSASVASVAARAEVTRRTRTRIEEMEFAEAVVIEIMRRPGAVSTIVRAAVQRAPAHRDAIAHRATIAFPVFAAEIAAAAGVPRAPRAPAVAPATPPQAAPSVSVASTAARAEITRRTRTRIEEMEFAEAVVMEISRRPGAVSAIVHAAVQRAPAHRDTIVHRATIAFPVFAAEIAAAAGVPRRPPSPAYGPEIAVAMGVPRRLLAPAYAPAPPQAAAAERKGRGPPGRARAVGPPSRRRGESVPVRARGAPAWERVTIPEP